MKIHIKLPGGGEVHMEKPPMSEDQRENLTLAAIPISFMIFMPLVFIILK